MKRYGVAALVGAFTLGALLLGCCPEFVYLGLYEAVGLEEGYTMTWEAFSTECDEEYGEYFPGDVTGELCIAGPDLEQVCSPMNGYVEYDAIQVYNYECAEEPCIYGGFSGYAMEENGDDVYDTIHAGSGFCLEVEDDYICFPAMLTFELLE
ncbi:hypothetical protein ACFL4G_06270 [Thermodesulfobacteriota bacterium]